MSKIFTRSPRDVQNITSAAASHSDEMHQRMVKYAVAMGIRMVCLVLVFVFPGWWKLVPILGAVFIPWFAVIIANAGGDTSNPDQSALLNQAPRAELEGAGGDPESAESSFAQTQDGSVVDDSERDRSHDIITGELVDEDADPPNKESSPNDPPPTEPPSSQSRSTRS